MALSFLYLAFVRILQLLRLSRRGAGDLAIEVVMLRHEVAILRRQWPALIFDHLIEHSLQASPD